MKELRLLGFVVVQSILAYAIVSVLMKSKAYVMRLFLSILIGVSVPGITVVAFLMLNDLVFADHGLGMIVALIMLAALISTPFTVMSAFIAWKKIRDIT